MSRVILISLVLVFACSHRVCLGESLTYDYAIELGEKNLRQGFYDEALHYFKVAIAIDPSRETSYRYIDKIEHIKNQARQISRKDSQSSRPPVPRSSLKRIPGAASRKQPVATHKKQVSEYLEKFSGPHASLPVAEHRVTGAISPSPQQAMVVTQAQPSLRHEKPKHTITLDQAGRDRFPLEVVLSPQDYFTVKGQNIRRVLVTAFDVAIAEKTDETTVMVSAEKYGTTFMHVWDANGRWTFNIRVVPVSVILDEAPWEEGEGFSFWYNANWENYYRGRRLGTMERKTVLFDQQGGLIGPTPYGVLDASVSWTRSGGNQEVDGYTVGLSDGIIGDFKDFKMRAFDFTKSFSDLTFPGTTLRGFLFESPVFNERLTYSVIYGREKRYFRSALFPGIATGEDAFVEGLRVGILPKEKHSAYVNYAHGYGDGRDEFLKEKVFSLQTEHDLDPLSFSTEVASDEEAFAGYITSRLKIPHGSLRLSLRDIEKKFVSITSRPPGVGEIGSLFEVDWMPYKVITLRSSLDIYRDRILYNPEERLAANYDWNGFLGIDLPWRSSLNSSLYYSNAPGLLSPHRNISGQTIYSKLFDINMFGTHALTTQLGYNYQRSINPLSPSSDYDRYGLVSGMRLSLTPDLSFYWNYNYSWLTELLYDATDNPSVVETGIDFYHAFTPKFSGDIRIAYRDEEKAIATHSFLAGEDSLEGSLGFKYMPTRDIELFCDGRVRNVWAENPDSTKYIEADFRTGARMAWDSFFRWSPTVRVDGFVFKDANGSGKKEKNEEGVPGARVLIGPKKVIADRNGKFSGTVRLVSFKVSIDPATIPQGYILTTPASIDVDSGQDRRKEVLFGVSSQTGIYGIIFYDANANGVFDGNDLPVAGAQVKLDNERITRTNAGGTYFFGGLPAGAHTVSLVVNSLPLQYIPSMALTAKIEVSQDSTATHHFPLQKK